MRTRAGVATDIGMVRERNEDSYLMDVPLFAVADGMGGHLGGEVASRLAVETLERRFRRRQGDLPDQVREANRVVFERSISDRTVAGMGTTLTAAVAEGSRLRLVHVGDSRAYLLRDGELRLLTEDHTLVHRMVQEGRISRQEAAVHPQRNILTRVLGVERTLEPDEIQLEVRPGDRLLLCTDGLTGMLEEEGIGQILASGRPPQETAEDLVRRANEAGGIDNTTVIVLDFEEGDDPVGDARSIPTATMVEASVGPRPSPPPARAERRDRDDRRPPRAPALPWTRISIWGGVIVAVALAGVIGTRLYLDRQWYVGVADGYVAVYRGIPTSVAGFDLHHVVRQTSIPADQAERLVLWRDLGRGITADDRESALAIVEQIRTDVSAMPAPGGRGP